MMTLLGVVEFGDYYSVPLSTNEMRGSPRRHLVFVGHQPHAPPHLAGSIVINTKKRIELKLDFNLFIFSGHS